MNPSSCNDDRSRLGVPLDEALVWFSHLRDDKIADVERAAFESWLAASPEHAKAYARVEDLWRSSALSAAMSHFADEALPTAPRYRSAAPRKPLRWSAAAAILLAAGWFANGAGLVDRWRADYVTVAGEQRRIDLPDGSTVTLNTDSALALDYGENRRGIRLLSGEAFFEVRPDSTRPFDVEAGEASIRVVGTRFSVAVNEKTSVSVESGIVACSRGRSEPVQLTQGQHTDLTSSGIAPITPVDTAQAFAWLKGRLVFKNRQLADVLHEVERYHRGKILVGNSRLADFPVTGNFKLDDPAAIVQALADATGGKVITLSPYLTIVR